MSRGSILCFERLPTWWWRAIGVGFSQRDALAFLEHRGMLRCVHDISGPGGVRAEEGRVQR